LGAPTATARGPLLFVGGVVFAVAVASFTRVPLLPDIGRELSFSVGELGLMTTVFAVGRIAMDLPAGRVADRLAPGRTLMFSGIGIVLAGGVLGAAQSLAQALAGMTLLGAASALTNTMGMTVFATWAPAARRGTVMAGFTTALMMGQSLGPALGGAVGGLAGWRAAQGFTAGLGLAVVCACLATRSGREGGPAAAARADADENGEGPAGELSRSEALVLASVPFGVFFAIGALPQTLIPLIGSADLRLSTSTIGLALGLGGLARFAGSLMSGVLSDRVSRKMALVPNLLLMAASVSLLALPPSRAGWLAAILLLSFASSGIAVAATIVADRVPLATVGRRLGTFRFTGDFGLLAGPAIAAALYEHAGREAAMFATAGLLLACALAAAKLVVEPAGPHRTAGWQPPPGA
jgi:predicted MFS family arabinose efflux permease